MSDQTKQTNGNKRSNTRAKKAAAIEPVPLTQDQLCKLWQIIVGGDLVVEQEPETGQMMYLVSLESFSQALPILLERL